MAAEDLSPPASPSSLPPYPEMILSAIEVLNDKNGSNKTAITKQIESTHGPLGPDHAALVSDHLAQMRQLGTLSLLKNNYLLSPSSPTASPAKRGRGRPPKPKSSLSSPAVLTGSPRPRGRPPKVNTVSPSGGGTVSPAAGGSGRGRGRPPKKAKIGAGDVAGPVGGVKKGRGRPPKVKTGVEEDVEV